MREKINKLFAGLGSVHIVRNGDLGLKNDAVGPSASGSIFKTLVTVFSLNEPIQSLQIT